MASAATAPRSRAKTKVGAPSPFAFLYIPRQAALSPTPANPPLREHNASYHRPRLLDEPKGVQQLLAWFEQERERRNMPWRQPWIDPDAPAAKHARSDADAISVHEQLKRRAYQVWISEIMLQQTRVETVREYWKSWMDRWPTIEALAAASADDVLAAWRGLGYYSRATRIHQGAQAVVQDTSMQGMLPDDVTLLQKSVPGVGRYTAGAISSIVFGHAVPILDGNVARVLSRQTALYTDPKAKLTVDLHWEMARLLVEHAVEQTHPGRTPDRSATPGQWNQALMELGSTLCTPIKPSCAACPIQATCAAYAEGLALSSSNPTVVDIEDVCTVCEELPEVDAPRSNADPASASSPVEPPAPKGMQQTTLFGKPRAPPKPKKGTKEAKPSPPTAHEHAVVYASQFPKKVVKQQVRVEARLVCIVRLRDDTSSDDQEPAPLYLVHQRPDKGLLASLWEFPTLVLDDGADSWAESDLVDRARTFVQSLSAPLWNQGASGVPGRLAPAAPPTYLGRVKHIFSHLQWDMHVCLVEVDAPTLERGTPAPSAAWLSAREVDAATMGTGLRRCWSLVPTRNIT